ncbi:MAG: hypothetical protein AABZ06_01725 [Bdellovibrionota bacterium]
MIAPSKLIMLAGRDTKQTKTMAIGFLMAIFMASIASCGKQSYRESPQNNNVSSTEGSSNGSVDNTDNTTSNLEPDLNPPLTFSFNIKGSGGYTTPAIDTDNVLKVRIISGPSEKISIPGYSNFTANYGCVSYKITVAGRSTVTSILSVSGFNGLCKESSDNQVIDFSNRLGQGHNSVEISVSEARYDFYCQLYMAGWVWGDMNMFCPLRTVYQNHTVTGSLEIQVNGTSL